MSQFKYSKLVDEASVKELILWHNANTKALTLDIETTGLDPFSDKILAYVITGKEPNSAVYIPGEFTQVLNQLCVDTLIFHNFKFDVRMLRRDGVVLAPTTRIRDTMLLHHLSEEEASHRLDDIITARYGDNYKSVFWTKYPTFESAPEAEQLEYACKDVIYTNLLYRDLLLSLQESGVPDSLIQHAHNLALALFDTECRGLKVDLDYLTAMGAELKPKILDFQLKMREPVNAQCTSVQLDRQALEIQKAYKPKGRAWKSIPLPEFNWDSHRQLGQLFYDKLGFPEQLRRNKKTKAYGRTVDDAALEVLMHLHPIVGMVQEYRTYQKVYTSFIEGTLERMRDGRIYPTLNVNGTVTGRISSSDPNLQQLPASGDWSRVRGIYIPDDGMRVISCDYGQLEVVIAAHFSHDKNLLKIVREGASKHDITAESVGLPRPLAKTLNFAMQYQCSPKKVAQIVGCSDSEAVYIWNKYWEAYAGEKKVIDECKAKVDAGIPIINPWGRQRHFPTKFEKSWHCEAAYRQAYSSLIQGTGADCTHWAFYNLATTLKANDMGNALFEVHDEIVLQAKLAACNEAISMVKSYMIKAGEIVNLTVPLTVDCSEPLVRWEK